MKQKVRNGLFTFSRVQRNGILALLFLLLALLAVRILVPYVSPSGKEEQPSPELVLAWNDYKRTHTLQSEEKSTDSGSPALQPFPFDPNTLDSAGFAALGLKPKTTHLLLNWRRKGKVFYHKEDLRPLYTLSEADYQQLEPYIRINIPERQEYGRVRYGDLTPLPAHIDLNQTDSATLVRLNGIGPVLAHKIIAQRNALGGFLKLEQLSEIYRFPDSVFSMLREKLRIDAASVHKLGINSVTFEELKTHPYIGEKVARNILLYREGLKRFENIQQLRQVPLMNEEIYRKIAPYFIIE